MSDVYIKFIKKEQIVRFRIEDPDKEPTIHDLFINDGDKYNKIFEIKKRSLKDKDNVIITDRMIIIYEVGKRMATVIWQNLLKTGFRVKKQK
jgi:hypothetical protein